LLLGGDGATLERLALDVMTFGGASVPVREILRSVRVTLGQATYRTNLLVVPDARFEYLLGADFFYTYRMVPDLRMRSALIGVSPDARVPSCVLPPRVYRQSLPIHMDRTLLRWPTQAAALRSS
jgi:hypothetical protein